ncbi:MAG: preprotein translocase subunit SecE [Bacillota bacterium]
MAKQTEAKGGKKPVKQPPKKKRRNIVRYFKETVSELKKVNWPTRKALINYTLAVLAFITLAAIITGAMDYVLALGLNLVVK